MLNKSIEYIIQQGLEDERKISPHLYEPSPGQIPSHVDYRVTQTVLKILAAEDYIVVKKEMDPNILLALLRSERQRWVDIREYAYETGDLNLKSILNHITERYVERNKANPNANI